MADARRQQGPSSDPPPNSKLAVSAANGPQLFPSGTYVVADPMMILSGDACWQHMVFNVLGDRQSATVRYRGRLVLVWVTGCGDGAYPLYKEGRFCARVETDNCLLCLAPVELLDLPCSEEKTRRPSVAAGLGVAVYEAEAAIPRVEGGVAIHGQHEIVTAARRT